MPENEQPSAKQILDDSAEGFEPTMAQKDLDGSVFMILGYRGVNTKFGHRRVATIQLSGRDESVDAWLGGAKVDRQLKALSDNSAFPVLVKLGHDPSIEGNPYQLFGASAEEKTAWEKSGDGAAASPGPTPEPGTFAADAPAVPTELQKLLQFCFDNDLCHESGNINSAKVLGILDLPVGENERAADVFKDYRNAIWREKDCSEDATYGFILENLETAIILRAPVEEASAEIPFE